MRIKRTIGMALVILGLGLTTASAASAAGGVVSGRLLFFNNQGSFCPTGRDCTAARYTQNQSSRDRPIRDAKVYIVSGSKTLGQGTTNSNGNFTMSWYKFRWWWQSQTVSAHIEWYGEHRDNRFKLQTASGDRWVFWNGNVTLVNGTTPTGPQNLGPNTWGNPASPNALANLYDGAVQMWRDSLNSSNRMRNKFNDVEIRAFDSAACPTSCASGNRITIDSTGSAFRPQARILHEMGHVASHASAPFFSCSDYSRDGANTGWGQTTAEFACASFEEGLATFFGDRAIYWQASPQPTTCSSAGSCPLTTSTENRGSGVCATGESRWALTANRYLRDLYDSVNESTDTNRNSFFRFFDNLRRFGIGVRNGNRNEPWGFTRSGFDRDGRSARDFRRHFEAMTGQSTASNFVANCSPTGD